MNIAVFGTGFYYEKYKYYLNDCNIQYLIDNNVEKKGTKIDGIEIYEPNQINYEQCAYIIILVKRYEKIKKQLLDLNVPADKIIVYSDIAKILPFKLAIKTEEGEITLKNWIEKNKSPRIMIISHELSRTGVPVALMNLSLLLKKMNYSVLLVSMLGGSLCTELFENDIDYIEDLIFFYRDLEFLNFAKNFDLFLPGTVSLCGELLPFAELGKPVVWWIHESYVNFYLDQKNPLKDFENVSYYAGGKRVIKALQNYWGIEYVSELLYYLPEKRYYEKKDNCGRIRFALIGAFSIRKAQDILVSAMRLLPKKYQNLYEILFVGVVLESEKKYYMDVKSRCFNFEHISEMSQSDLDIFYNTIDVLICPSRDDPMPIVVTEAMQYGIPCIVSEQVGQEEYIQSGESGFVFENEDFEALSQIMQYIIENPIQLKEMGNKARKIYEENFSENQIREKLEVIFNELL